MVLRAKNWIKIVSKCALMYVFQHANSQNTHYMQKNSVFLEYVKMGPFPSILKNGGGGLERICSALGKIGLLGLMAELDKIMYDNE